MNKCSLAISLISLPLTIILRSVLPDLLAIAIFKAIQKFTGINSSVCQCNRTIRLSIVVVYHFISNSIIIWTSTLRIIIFPIIILWHHGWMNVIHHLSVILSLTHFLLLLWMIILIIPSEILVPTLIWVVVLIRILIVSLIECLLTVSSIICILLLGYELVLVVKLLSFCHLVLRDHILIFIFSWLTSHT